MVLRPSFGTFFEFSESTAFSSLSVESSLKSGLMKNCEKLKKSVSNVKLRFEAEIKGLAF